MNKTIIGRQRKSRHPVKDASFDILSLANQLYRSKSTYPRGPDIEKLYFSENQVPDLLIEGRKALPSAIEAYNLSISTNDLAEAAEPLTKEEVAEENIRHNNQTVAKLFNTAREERVLTADLSELYL